MLFLALLFLTFSAGTGFTLAYAIFMKRFPTPRLPVCMHGVMSSAGLIFIFVYAIGNYRDFPLVGLILFVATALLGFYLFRNDIFRNRPGPRVVVVIHAVFALVALGILIATAYQLYVAAGLAAPLGQGKMN